MASEGAASTLVLVAAILELVGFIISIVGIAVFFLLTWIWLALLLLVFPELMIGVMLSIAAMVLTMIFGLIFAILWFIWRKAPSQHKMALIITGVITIVFAILGYLAPYALFGYFGFIPGILVIIGGAIAKKGA